MKAICIAPKFNSGAKHDATGAFQPEARAFVKRWGGTLLLVDNLAGKAAMRRAVLEAVGADPPDVLALFCHGWNTGIQFGFGLRDVPALAELFRRNDHDPVIAIYGCLTGGSAGPGGDGGFADVLRDALCAVGQVQCQVDAHTTAGHATRNPYVRRFEGGGVASGGVGGYYLVTPRSAKWQRWVRALQGDLRLRFPLMSAMEIHAELEGA
jgi:hypothetical protein